MVLPLLKEAETLAQVESATLSALVERGLQLAIAERRPPRKFKLRNASVDGNGMHPDAAVKSWGQIRARTYEGRGRF